MLARLRVVASRAAQTARAMSTAASVPVEVWCRARAGGQLHAARDRAAATLPHPSLPTRPQVHNPGGALRVVVTKELPGDRWLAVLTAAGCRVEVCTAEQTILDNATIKRLIGDKCDGVIGQLTEVWDGGVGGGGRGAGGTEDGVGCEGGRAGGGANAAAQRLVERAGLVLW